MFKKFKLIGLILIFITTCSEPKTPVLKIGKDLNNEKTNILSETDKFTYYDNFAYILSSEIPFHSNIITRRFYKGKVYIDLIQRESVDINIDPAMKEISDTIRVRDLARKYGYGNFMILFIINDSVIAKKAFIIEWHKSAAQSEEPVAVRKKSIHNPEDSKPLKREMPGTSKPLAPSLSPSEMMNTQ